MRGAKHTALTLGMGLALLATLACEGAGSNAILGSGDGVTTSTVRFGITGELVMQEGLSLASDPEEIRLDPCEPETPTDPETGKLLGSAAVAALLLDAELNPVADVEVVFSSSTGSLASGGQPVRTDAGGLAMDTLTVDEDDAGEVMITASSGEQTATLSIPVLLLALPPVSLAMSPGELWPPNHRMREVSAVFDGLDCDPEATFELVSVTSNEPAEDGEADIDGADVGTADTELWLRAERSGRGDGRVYTIVYQVIDGAGEMSMLEASVRVPHDQGH